MTVSNFTGNFTTDDDRITPYIVTVDHPDSPPRQFIGELFRRTWDKSTKPCLYAGDSQGASSLDEPSSLPNDPVIAGTFRNYEVPDLFSSDFVFSKFEQQNCTLVTK